VHRIDSFVGNVCSVYGRGIAKVRKRRASAAGDRGTDGASSGRGRASLNCGDESGQALVLAIGCCFVLIAAALALVAIAGAITGKGRAQRAADLAAISAVRSMRDDLPKLLSPPRLPDGAPNPSHITKSAYLAEARGAALAVARQNEVDPHRLRIDFPDRSSFAPLRAKATLVAKLEVGSGARTVEASAEAEAAAPVTTAGGEGPAMASGGGYSGPLVYRNGEGMRPDVAAAYDRMAAAAAADGITLIVVSGFRSDAEQAELFAAHPDPKWVAPPGTSLHRCATELDLGPESAYGWIDANGGRFGFVQRYSWEAWHMGFARPPAPCSEAGNAVTGSGQDAAPPGGTTLPSFVPPRFRDTLIDAASRWNVSAALLAAQVMAESNFNPFAVSPAGAEGIAQFMPGTAASYGLADPFDPVEAIDAQAHLMSDLIHQFGSPELALAAYNAGPAPVEACSCVPAIPETSAYVARIMALLGGAGALAVPAFEVRLIA
jgi:hypothetical protein